MGRGFDAIKRAKATNQGEVRKPQATGSERRSEVPSVPGLPSARQSEEQPLGRLSLPAVSHETVQNSASSAHTADVPGGMALPGRMASRDAGATLDAAGTARVGGCVTHAISPARVEPHRVAVSQPHSHYCEQFRSLRTQVLQAGEHEQMRAIVITSAGVGEGKTLTALNLAWLLAQTD